MTAQEDNWHAQPTLFIQHFSIVAYARTDLLQPGEIQAVVLTFDAYDLASYDGYDANRDGFAGYELEMGEYIFTVGKNAHEAWDSVKTTLTAGVHIAADSKTVLAAAAERPAAAR